MKYNAYWSNKCAKHFSQSVVHIMFKQGTSATVQIHILDSILPGWVSVTHCYEKGVHMKSCEIL